MPNDLSASLATRLLFKIYGPNLDDAANRAALEALRAPLGATLYAATDSPDLVTPFPLQAREHIVHARWAEIVRGGLRADVVTNIGRGERMLGGNNYRIVPRQVVVVFLPQAPVQHLLFPVVLNARFPIASPHISLAQSEHSTAQPAPPTFDVHLWRANGLPFLTLRGAHGYRFSGCIDGVLYADCPSPRLDPASAVAALDELRAIADLPWEPPSAAALAHAAASIAANDASTRDVYRALFVLGALILGSTLVAGIAMLIRSL